MRALLYSLLPTWQNRNSLCPTGPFPQFIEKLLSLTFESSKWFLLALITFFLVYVLLLKDKIDFLEHLEHELEHAALAFIFTGQLPKKMVINPDEKSEVQVAGGGCLMVLAPYYFPLLTIPFLLLTALLALLFHLLKTPFPSFLGIALDVLIGGTLGFHLAGLAREFRPSQPDIQRTGCLASVVTVGVLNLFFLMLTLAIVVGDYASLWVSAKDIFGGTMQAYGTAFDLLKTRVLPALGDLAQWLRLQFCQSCSP